MAGNGIVKPRPLSGFPEWLPAEKLVENRWLAIIREEFERCGFTPVETPAVERTEILTAKGIVDKEIYTLSRLSAAEGEDAGTEMSLHFDLTVPLARYVAQHFNQLVFPFRRYQMQKVWRGERPQAGRFREFYQCDIDIIGNGSLDLLADAEIPSVINAIFQRAGLGRFVIRINNRKVLQGFLAHLGIEGEEARGEALRAIDALDKIGADKVREALIETAGLTATGADDLLDFVTGDGELAAFAQRIGEPLFRQGVDELEQVVRGMDALGVPQEVRRIDRAIARGLDYYTGTVYETQLVDYPEIGSICSGGRYDNLASNYTKQTLPGVGISIGLSRLLSRLFAEGLVAPGAATPAPVLVTTMDRVFLDRYLAMTADLRAAGIATEIYSEPKKLPQQLKYADAKGFSVAVLAGDQEFAADQVVVKDLARQQQQTVARVDLVDAVRRLLA